MTDISSRTINITSASTPDSRARWARVHQAGDANPPVHLGGLAVQAGRMPSDPIPTLKRLLLRYFGNAA